MWLIRSRKCFKDATYQLMVVVMAPLETHTHTRKLDAEESGFFENFLGGRSQCEGGRGVGGTEVHRECSWLAAGGAAVPTRQRFVAASLQSLCNQRQLTPRFVLDSAWIGVRDWWLRMYGGRGDLYFK